MQPTDFESDPFLRLLTDALRAGPGSPEWHQAVRQLRAEGRTDLDEYRLLCTAREDLESGREYRSVRPGANFTKKVLDGIEAEAEKSGRGPSTSSILIVIAAAAICGVVILVAALLMRSPRAPLPPELSGVYSSTVLSDTFAREIGPAWRPVGPLELVAADGLRLAPIKGGVGREYRGGGLVTRNPLPADSPVAAEAEIRLEKQDDNLLAQVFITSQTEFNQQASTPHELVCFVKAGRPTVILPNDAVVDGEPLRGPFPRTVRLTMRASGRFALVECNGRQIWAGESGLQAGQDRYAGVRFITRGGAGGAVDAASVQSVTILKP